jgi:probable F420-dependent oxidoreductase
MDWREAASEVERLGYSSLSMPDHLGSQYGPIAALSFAAATTKELRLTNSVLANDLRHPVMLAKEMATLDVLSGGRVELGLGTGWMTSDYRALGLTVDSPAIRLARLAEAVQLLRLVWSGARVEFNGKHYQVGDLEGWPLPTQGQIPIMLGGAGRRMLGLAAQVADIVSIGINASAGQLTAAAYRDAIRSAVDRKIGWTREAAGRRWDDLEVCIRVLRAEITDDPEEARRRHAQQLGLDASDLVDSPHFLIGSPGDMVEAIHRYREELGISYFVVSGDAYPGFAPAVEKLTGT